MATIVIFRDYNFKGPARILTEADANLYDTGWNDKVSSAFVADGSWELFRDTHYEGPKFGPLDPNGGPGKNGLYPGPESWGGKNDDISSLKPV